MSLSILLKAALTTLSMAGATAYNTNDQVFSDIPYGTFENPSVHVRPRFRYRIPDASVSLTEVRNDFALIKQAGMGGMELLGYYLYSNYPNGVAEGAPTPVD